MLLADTGPLVAGANSRDRHHQVCRAFLLNHPGPILVPAPVIVEVCQLLAARQGTQAEATFLTTLGAGALKVVDLDPADYSRAAALVTQYADLPLGAVDATVIAIAERLRITEIATLDRRHFTVVRPTHTGAFTLLPESLS
jgi:predicted nucleic acid-binding protein